MPPPVAALFLSISAFIDTPRSDAATAAIAIACAAAKSSSP